ncbi:S1C family serine protease [Halanaerobium salsuginis]|jgi:S1-C subfamily serine protease|uniref:Serine protease, S1-C subfamily, contains C-terminal PDZ domain n=1 Tax=Halanaerobium salsuginis TaxID=29563 RepID=A0A1I4H0A4_9FIRM|nr:trypsin-like peptidase domain-containing protein [Halanaerobium salsuginis]SFL35615.1 serine protease, S1-C subfamily, contains C-terminal PDZ domain [Halanaerobium salsuginis]
MMTNFLKQQGKLCKGSLLILLITALILAAVPNVMAQSETKGENIYQSNYFADIAGKVNNGVVMVTSTIKVDSQQQLPQMFNDPYFRFFFGDQFQAPEQKPRETQAFGSGFIVSKDGYIVTNQHVVNKADKVEVTINGIDEPVKADVAWSDYSLDLAILKIDTDKLDQDLTVLKMGDSDVIRPGDWAIAIGNPLGFDHTVTVGVISALGRPIQIPGDDRKIRTYQNLIQLDAAINPGNSGGPLLNNQGEVIGINTAVSTSGQNIGFAIPINEITGIVKELRTTGKVTRPWLGISFSEISQEMQDYFNLENKNGVVVIEVYQDSPADKAGLKAYDVIKEIDQQKVKTTADVSKLIKSKDVGDKIMFKVLRNGKTQIIFGRIGNKPNDV